MRETRFIIVEGIMGAGKSAMVETLTDRMTAGGMAARALWEGPTVDEPEHPLRMSTGLPHPFAPWQDLSTGEYLAESLHRWACYVREVTQTGEIVVCDGLLFHGNMTDLMLMGAPLHTMRAYVTGVMDLVRPLSPAIIYLRRPNIREALRAIVSKRGPRWEAYQVNWKLASPYARERSLEGFEGLVSLYEAYRAVCDQMFEELTVPKLQIENRSDWGANAAKTLRFLRCRL